MICDGIFMLISAVIFMVSLFSTNNRSKKVTAQIAALEQELSTLSPYDYLRTEAIRQEIQTLKIELLRIDEDRRGAAMGWFMNNR